MSAINFNTSNQAYCQLMGNGLTYHVPRFQRDYSWTDQEWDDRMRKAFEWYDRKIAQEYTGKKDGALTRVLPRIDLGGALSGRDTQSVHKTLNGLLTLMQHSVLYGSEGLFGEGVDGVGERV